LKDYSEDNFEELIALLVEKFDYQASQAEEFIVELCTDGMPIFRLMYESNSGLIICIFHVATPAVEAIQINNFILSNYKLVKLGECYFYNGSETSIGQEAYIEYENYLENYYSTTKQIQKETENISDHRLTNFVTYIVNWPMYEATHPSATEAYRHFKNRKKIIF